MDYFSPFLNFALRALNKLCLCSDSVISNVAMSTSATARTYICAHGIVVS